MRYYAFILLSALIISMSGCKKFLEETPYSTTTTDGFYTTAGDAELALTGLYDILNAQDIQGQGNQPMWGRGLEFMTAMGCDELIGDPTKNSSDINFVTIANYTYGADNTLLRYSYIGFYAGINRANMIIERVPAINMDATRRQQIVAEARFMKGMFYCYLGWFWGGVPLADNSTVDPKAVRAPLSEILNHAETDLKYAYDNLPSRNSKAGRVNKYTAAAFLAKLYLYEASCRENNVGETLNFPLNSFAWVDKDKAYQNALAYCSDIYANSGYTLIRPFNYLFLAATESAARSEHMFTVQAGSGGQNEYILYFNLAGPTGNYLTVGGTAGWMRPVREAWNRYNVNDGRRALSFSGPIASTATSYTINGFKYYNTTAVASNLSNICINKWRVDDPTDRSLRGIPAWAGDVDYGVLRYADVLLMYAEACYKTGDEAGARTLFTELRLRACADDVAKVNTITTAYRKANFMDELLDERSRELMGEGWRRFDLIRTGKLAAVVAALDPSVMFTAEDVTSVKTNFAGYKIWYPIPRREMETNNNLVQNVGY